MHDIARIAAIKRALFAPWCFRRSVAGLQHIWAALLECRENRHPRARLKLDAEPRSGAGDAGVADAQIRVRDMAEDRRDVEPRVDLVAELGALAEQDAGAQPLLARRRGVDMAVMDRAAEAAVGKDPVAGAEQALDQHDPPGQAEIAVAGMAAGVDVGADMRPRRDDDPQ